MDITDRDKTIGAAEEHDDSEQDAMSGAEYGLLRPGDEGYEEELAQLRAEIQVAIDQIERGEVYTAEEVFADLEEHIQKIARQAE